MPWKVEHKVFSGARHVNNWSLKLHFNYACSTKPIYMIFGILQVQTPENTLPKFEYIWLRNKGFIAVWLSLAFAGKLKVIGLKTM